jgi:multidrug efflux pump subunit AcrA (membrane-fusion protein)
MQTSARRSVTALLALALTLTACRTEPVEPFGTAEVTVEPVVQVIATPATVLARTYAATVRTAERADVVAPGAASVAALDVADGDTVVAGQRLGRLTSDALTTALRQAEAARTSALTSLRAAADALTLVEQRAPEDPLNHPDRLDEIGAQLANVREDIVRFRADEDLFRLRIALAREQQLLTEYDQWVRAGDSVTAARAALAQADQALAQARRAVAELVLVAPLDGVVRLAPDLAAGGGRDLGVGSDVAPGQAVVTVTGVGLRAELVVAEADLAPVVTGARVVLDLEAYPGTPVPGRVVRVERSAGAAAFTAEVALEDDAGLPLRDGLTGTAVLPDLAFTDRFEVRLEVDEIDVVLVTVGQQVSVELDALRGRPLTGTLVALAATPERSTTGATVYRARVRLDPPSGDAPPLRGGLTGTGDVEVQRLEGPLTVPSTALRRSGGNEVVYVVRGGVAVEVPVRVLAFGEARAAVEGDLRAGERVVTVGVERVEDGAPVVTAR